MKKGAVLGDWKQTQNIHYSYGACLSESVNYWIMESDEHLMHQHRGGGVEVNWRLGFSNQKGY